MPRWIRGDGQDFLRTYGRGTSARVEQDGSGCHWEVTHDGRIVGAGVCTTCDGAKAECDALATEEEHRADRLVSFLVRNGVYSLAEIGFWADVEAAVTSFGTDAAVRITVERA